MRSLFFAPTFTALALVISLSSHLAHASLSLTTRADYTNVRATRSNNLPDDLPGSSSFDFSLVKINASAKLAGGEAYLTLDPTAADSIAFTGSSGFLDTLFFMKPLQNDWWFKFGKLPNMTGGFEALYIDSGDDYWGSLANLNPKLDPAAPSGNRVYRLGNVEGIALGFDEKHSSFELQVLSDIDSGNTVNTAQDNSNSFGAVYTRNFKDYFWIKLHYFVYRIDDAAMDVDMNFRGIGLRWLEGRHDVTFDYLYNGYINQAVSTDEDITSSLILNYRFAWTEQSTPVFKAEYSELVDQPSNIFDMKRVAVSIGLEYVPKKSEALRYHVALVSVNDDYKTDRDVTQPRFIAGLKFDADLLK